MRFISFQHCKISILPKSCILVFLGTIGFFGGTSVGFSENFIPLTECENEMIKGFTLIEQEFKQQFKTYVSIQGTTMTAKTKHFPSYQATYDCRLNTLCTVVKNPSPSAIIPRSFGECNNGFPTVQEFQNHFGLDFSSCAPNLLHTTNTASLIYSRCEGFAEIKKTFSKSHMASENIRQTALENHSLLGQKILDINKKMEILLQKTRAFVIAFTKVHEGINCTIESSSGPL